MKKVKKTIAAGALVIASSWPGGAFAYYCPPYDEISTSAYTQAIELAMKLLWKLSFSNLSNLLLGYDKRELASLKVVATQISTAARTELKAKTAIGQAKVSALSYLENVNEQLRVFQKYGSETGQGIDPCEQFNAQTTFQQSNAAAQNTAITWLSELPSASGSYSRNSDYMNAAQRLREEKFATSDEVALGLGKTARAVKDTDGNSFSLAGADTNAAVLFVDSDDPDLILAKKQFISNIVGMPDEPFTSAKPDSPAMRQYRQKKGVADVMRSASAYSLTTLAADHTPTNGVPAKARSLSSMTGLYFGEKAATRWMGWMGQDQHGLRQDLMRMQAVNLTSKVEQYKNGQRTEMLLALIVSDEARKMQAEIAARTETLSERGTAASVN